MITKSEMRKEIKALFASRPNHDYNQCHIIGVGRDYIHFVSLHEGAKKQKIDIETFHRTGSLFAD